MTTLESLAPCFQGIIPAQLCTCSADGMPNVAYLSHVEYVDPGHVALSFQFFNKSRRNIAENPLAEVLVVDPDTGQGWSLQLRYVRSETSGPLFDRMALRIEAIATYSGLKGVFKLRAADVYRVLDVQRVPEETGRSGDAPVPALEPVFTFTGVRRLMDRISGADSLEALIDAILAGFEEAFACGHTVMLMPSEQQGVLVTVATRGYTTQSVGAEVRFGEGVGGFVAEARTPLRISGLVRGMLYALAMHSRSSEPPLVQRTRQIPAAGLENADSQLGIPLLVRDELVGVIVLESTRPYRFHEEDKACVEVLGRHLALAIQHMQWQERMHDPPAEESQVAQRSAPLVGAPARRRSLVYHCADECVLLDGEYLIRGLPARILWRLLKIRDATGREEFTNRELRLDKALQLPAWKDNLESRLILLRRRLSEKCPDVRLASRGRGRFALEVDAMLDLSEQP